MLEVTGHRGAASYEPENTLRSFEKAIELGVDQIELDVHLSKDNELIVIHDEKLDRTTNGKGYVKDFTLAELKKFDAGKGEVIPTLREVFELVKNKDIVLQVELKSQNSEVAAIKLIEEYNYDDRVILISFHPKMLKNAKTINPRIKTGILVGDDLIDPIQLIKRTRADRIHINFRRVTKKLVNHLHKKGIKIIVWTVDDPEDIEKMIKLGVDGICSNKPDLVISELRRKQCESTT